MPKAKALLRERGTDSLKLAQKIVAEEKVQFEPLQNALNYFMEEIWLDLLHPALLSLSCQAAGGNPEKTVEVGAALVLLAGGADVHDDIIDQSQTKEKKQTVFGKFGMDTAILVGDALLLEGLYLLHKAVGKLPADQNKQVLAIVKEAFWGISSAEAVEASFRGITELSGLEYLKIIKNKVAVAEATMKIGAIIGGGTTKEIELLSEYGQIFGLLNTIRDEYIDVFEEEELKNRVEKECLPLPILYTFKNPQKKELILQLLKWPLKEGIMERIIDLTMDSEETRELTQDLKKLVTLEIQKLVIFKKIHDKLELLLVSTTEDL